MRSLWVIGVVLLGACAGYTAPGGKFVSVYHGNRGSIENGKGWTSRVVSYSLGFNGIKETPDMADTIRAALGAWRSVTGLSFREVVEDSADIVIRVIGEDNQGAHGWTGVSRGRGGYISGARMELMVGRGDVTYMVALHEVGHALGFGHSLDSLDIMAPLVRVDQFSARDTARARRIYANKILQNKL